MSRLGSLPMGGDEKRWTPLRRWAVRSILVCMEAVVLVLFCVSPWVFGAVHPLPELMLYAGVGVLLALWAIRMLLEWRLTWRSCPVTLCLGALFLAGVGQVVPLPARLLNALSPTTVKVCRQLLPSQPEVLPAGEGRAAAALPAGRVISLYPGATRRELTRLLAVFLLFAVVRNNLTSSAALRRLSIVAVANGAALALFALVQFFTSRPGVVYWTWETRSGVFGPFFCRNHYPYYVNMCVALGTGLLLSLRSRGRGARRHHRRGSRGHSAAGGRAVHRWLSRASAVLRHPKALWVMCALGLMVSSVIFCLSRGGLLALVGGCLVCSLLALSRSAYFSRLALPVLALFVALGLVSWFGLDRVQARYRTLWTGGVDDRTAIWFRALPMVKDFPVWGTGWGTFRHVEPLHRAPGEDPTIEYDHAHNDYVEALTEGGLVGLVLGLLASALVLRRGYQAFRQRRRRRTGGLVLGALFAFVTILVHSFFDFGLHVPAVAFAATVVGAHLTALPELSAAGSRRTTRAELQGGPAVFSLRFGGLAPLAGVAMVLLPAWALYGEGRRAERAAWWARAAARCHAAPSLESRQREQACLEAAVEFSPDDAALQVALAETQVAPYKEQKQRLAASGSATAAEEKRLAREYLVPGLRHYLLARDLCPLLPGPHIAIAAHLGALERADPRTAYLERAKFLLPFEPELWYHCGVFELGDGRSDQAWESWRQSLVCSDHFLEPIVIRAARRLGPRGLLDKVLPENPRLLLLAASVRCPELAAPEQRRLLLDRALALLEGRGGPPPPPDPPLKALAYQGLGQPEQALAAFRAAVARAPDRADWRCVLARLLHDQGQIEEARRQARVVLEQQPGNAEARSLVATQER